MKTKERILIDTNILLDVLCARPGLVNASSIVWKYCETETVEGYVSALSVPNIIYILRKELDPEKIRQIINILSMIFDIEDLKAGDLISAAEIMYPDYEDAVQMCCAKRIGAKYIITRNLRDFKESAVPALTPEEYIEKTAAE